MKKELKFSSDARTQMTKGVKALYDATRFTFGPRGRNVIIEQEFGTPLIVNDGVTIAKAIKLLNAFENLGSGVVIEAASKTNDVVGDGTTTAIILASKMIFEGIKQIEAGINPVIIQKGLSRLLPHLLMQIDEASMPVESLDDLAKVASISSNSMEIGEIIKEAYLEVGTDGSITVEESPGITTFLDVVKGYTFDRGFLSPYMANQQDKQVAVLEKPLIYLTDKKIITMNELVSSLEVAIKAARPILIICDDIEPEVLSALIVNKLRGIFQVVVTKAPGFGERKTKLLEDLAIITGASFIDTSLGISPNNESPTLGSALKVIINKDQTIIIDGEGSSEAINNRINRLKNELKDQTSEYEKDRLSERIAKITSGVAIIKVGAPTETELKEKKLRIEDALHATKAANASGIIEGGGKIYYQMSLKLPSFVKQKDDEPASEILQTALQAPFFQIVENAGADIQEVLKNVNESLWYDANRNEFASMLTNGIIDPSSVAKSALINAVSVASMFLTTECAIINLEQKKIDIEDPLS